LWFHKPSSIFRENNLTDTVLLCSHKFESELITTILKKTSMVNFLGRKCLQGRTDTKTVTIVITGPDADFYNSTFKNAAKDLSESEIVFFGTSVSLNPQISLGDVVTAYIPFSWKIKSNNTPGDYIIPGAISEIMSENGKNESYYSYNFKHWSGSVATCNHNSELCADLRNLTNEPLIDCIDGSSGYGARICSRAGLRFITVKGISHIAGSTDPADSINDKMKAVIHGSYLVMDYLSSEKTIPDWLENRINA